MIFVFVLLQFVPFSFLHPPPNIVDQAVVDPKLAQYSVFPNYDSSSSSGGNSLSVVQNPSSHIYLDGATYSSQGVDSYTSFESGSSGSALFPKGYAQPGRSEVAENVAAMNYGMSVSSQPTDWDRTGTNHSIPPPSSSTSSTVSSSTAQYQHGSSGEGVDFVESSGNQHVPSSSLSRGNQPPAAHDAYLGSNEDLPDVDGGEKSGTVDSSSSQDVLMRELQKRVQALELELERSRKTQNQVPEMPQQTSAHHQYGVTGSYSPQATGVIGRSAFSAPIPVHHNHSGQALLSHATGGHTGTAAATYYRHPSAGES